MKHNYKMISNFGTYLQIKPILGLAFSAFHERCQEVSIKLCHTDFSGLLNLDFIHYALMRQMAIVLHYIIVYYFQFYISS